MSKEKLHRLFNRARLDDRLVNQLVGIAHGIIADGVTNRTEAEYLFKWLVANRVVADNPMVGILYERLEGMLEDGVLDHEESAELLDTLSRFCAGDFEIGETLKPTTLPLCNPVPQVKFINRHFCFTGTFAFGSRRDCEAAITARGGTAGSLRKETRYLVIGAYATESWIQTAWGRKIEKAVDMRARGLPISIISETHWVTEMRKTDAQPASFGKRIEAPSLWSTDEDSFARQLNPDAQF